MRLENVQDEMMYEYRWRYPDDRDASLFWRTKISVLSSDQGVLLTLVIRIESGESVVIPARPMVGTPRIIRTLISRGDAQVGKQILSMAPKSLEASEMESFLDFLESQDRLLPVVLVSLEPNTEKPVHDAKKLAEMVAGSAMVYLLESKWAGFALTNEVGKALSCFNGAIRLYWPRFSRSANPRAHQLWMAPELSKYSTSVFYGELLNLISSAAAYRYVEPMPIRAFRTRFEQHRQLLLKEQMKVKRDYDELYDEWCKSQQEIEEHLSLLGSSIAENDFLKQEIENLKSENKNLKENLESCQAYSPETATSSNDETETQEPDVFASVLEAVKYTSSETKHILYLEEAFSSAADSPFLKTGRVREALLAIDDVAGKWVDQLNGGPLVGSREERFREYGFFYKDNISETTENKWGDEYKYYYKDRKILFASHITIGKKQANKCLSIHLFWDDDNSKVVVAHIGRHKTNTST